MDLSASNSFDVRSRLINTWVEGYGMVVKEPTTPWKAEHRQSRRESSHGDALGVKGRLKGDLSSFYLSLRLNPLQDGKTHGTLTIGRIKLTLV